MIGVGTLHLVQPDFFMKIMPPYLPLHLELVYLSGVLEAALGLLLLVPRTSRLTYLVHLTRDHSFNEANVKPLTIDEQAKLHAAAHFGY